eukprot:gene24579-29696_t
MTSWLKLSPAERDELLISIPYVSKPVHHGEIGGTSEDKNLRHQVNRVNFGGKNLINYSQIYAACKRCVGLPNPLELRTGDVVSAGGYDYRGCGSYYVIWLRKGIITHSDKFIAYFKQSLVESATEENFDDSNEPRSKKAKLDETSVPMEIPRDADGPHNDGNHDCYLSVHPDENGYATSTVLSSAPQGYHAEFCSSEYETLLFDPVLTHTQSYAGLKIAEAKPLPDYVDCAAFPDCFIGSYREAVGEDVEWIPLESALGLDGGGGWGPHNYFAELRDLYNRHFFPGDPPAVLPDRPLPAPGQRDEFFREDEGAVSV